jgi:tetratricopeptide (TPR) repeat protein
MWLISEPKAVRLLKRIVRAACLIGVRAAVLYPAAPALAQTRSPLSLYPALFDTLVGGHYEAARDLCGQIESASPGHPASLYARIAVIYAHMVDLEDTTGRAEFIGLSDSCMLVCQQLEKSHNGSSAELAYLRGSALAARGLCFNHEGKLVPALRALIQAHGAFEDAIDADPQFYDAYLGRGAYRYAVATHASLLRWLPFIPSKESGWQDMWLAVRRSTFSRATALTSIVWHLMDEGDFATADTIIQSQLQRFPRSRNFLWPQLAYYERQSRWAQAEQTAKVLLDEYLALPENKGYDAIGLYWRLMTCADSLGRPEDAKAYARAGMNTYRTPDVARRRADRLREMQSRLSAP